MGLDLFMLGLIVKDMEQALAFYRRLGLAIPEGSEAKTHVEIKMGNGLTFFLDSRPTRWDDRYLQQDTLADAETTHEYRSVLEFYLKTRKAVDAMYTELTSHGAKGRRAPYEAPIGMYFAMIDDPDGNTVLLSGELG